MGFDPRLKWERTPRKGIPLFSGLKRGQIAGLLMASGALRKIEPGQVLFNKGDPSDFMYAIVPGAFDVVDPDVPAIAEIWGSGKKSPIFAPEMWSERWDF